MLVKGFSRSYNVIVREVDKGIFKGERLDWMIFINLRFLRIFLEFMNLRFMVKGCGYFRYLFVVVFFFVSCMKGFRKCE